jgi:UDP-N-acetylmuramate dehydrogenase
MNALVQNSDPLMLQHEPMSKHTSWRVGGPAEIYVQPASVSELQVVLAQLPPDLPIVWMGLGSNLLVRDGGIRGAVIGTTKLAREIERRGPTRVVAGCGVPCATFARQCVRWQLGPAAFLAGIPGSIGGALAMNAGAFGHETWECVESVDTIDRHGTLRTRTREEFRIAYRSTRGPDQEWFLRAQFAFAPDTSADPAAIRALLRQRKASQPLGWPSCGSVFRNPPGQFAGQLIESAGLKGRTIGGARVSDKHANFIINTGAATAADIEALIELVRDEVRARCGIELEPEVRIIGEPVRGGSA